MDLTFRIKGKAIVRDADYISTPQEVEEAIEEVLMDYLGVDANIHIAYYEYDNTGNGEEYESVDSTE